MICPKCEIGMIKKMVKKNSGAYILVCGYCETAWQKDEEIKLATGRPFTQETGNLDLEYVLEESEEKDHDHRDAKYPKIK